MESAFIEFLNQLYDTGYAENFRENNPDAYYRQLAEFENQYNHKKMRHHTYLTVRVELQTDLPLIEAVRELEDQTQISVSGTSNIQVLETELLKSILPNPKTKDNGTQS